MIVLTWRAQSCKRRVDILWRRRWRIAQGVERDGRWAAKWCTHQRDRTESVRPYQRRPGCDRRAEVVPDHRCDRAVAERIHQTDSVACEVGRTPGRKIRIVIRYPARRASIPTQ